MGIKTLNGFGLTTEYLQELIREAVASEIRKSSELFKTPKAEEKDLLTRKEAKDFLQVSYTSLWNYGRQRLIKPKNIGGRVYYSKTELLNLVNDAA